jgi:hypothetical protein
MAKTKQKTYLAVRVSDGEVVGEHSSKDLALKRIKRLVSMSRGRLTEKAFKVRRK